MGPADETDGWADKCEALAAQLKELQEKADERWAVAVATADSLRAELAAAEARSAIDKEQARQYAEALTAAERERDEARYFGAALVLYEPSAWSTTKVGEIREQAAKMKAAAEARATEAEHELAEARNQQAMWARFSGEHAVARQKAEERADLLEDLLRWGGGPAPISAEVVRPKPAEGETLEDTHD